MVLNYFQLNSCPQATATRNMRRQYEVVLSVLYQNYIDTKRWHWLNSLLSTTVDVSKMALFIHYSFIAEIRLLQLFFECSLKSGISIFTLILSIFHFRLIMCASPHCL